MGESITLLVPGMVEALTYLVTHNVQQVVQRQKRAIRSPQHQLDDFAVVPVSAGDCAWLGISQRQGLCVAGGDSH
jgi:hypothetical protein